MSTSNNNWYNRNEQRSFPLDESVRLVSDDNGIRLPSAAIVGLRLHFPIHLGRYAYLSSIGITPRRISVTVGASNDFDGANRKPVGVFSIDRDDFVEGRQYPIRAQVPGVGGWIAFGSAIDSGEAYSGKFNGPASAHFAASAYRAYNRIPVEQVSRLGQQSPLTGIVRLAGRSPLEIVTGEVEIAGEMQDAIIVQLSQRDGESTPGDNSQSVLEQFAGPQEARPASGNCVGASPIEAINIVPPDCDGNVNIELEGCVRPARDVDGSSIVLDCGLGLGEACVPSRLPDEQGNLAGGSTDLCDVASPQVVVPATAQDLAAIGLSPPTAEPLVEVVESVELLGELPYLADFGDSEKSQLRTTSGWFSVRSENGNEFGYLTTDNPVAKEKTNTVVWDGWDYRSSDRYVSVNLVVLPGPTAPKRNAGIVLNYLDDGQEYSYFLVDVDYDTRRLSIRKCSNGRMIDLGAFVSLEKVILREEYNLRVVVRETKDSNVTISAELRAASHPEKIAKIGPYITTRYYPDTGRFGLHTDRSLAEFRKFEVGVADD